MSDEKKQKRDRWNRACLDRDGGKCRICGQPAVEVHHITARSLCPRGGYVIENGISVCARCHLAVEVAPATHADLGPAALYLRIGTTHARAFRAMGRLDYDELDHDERTLDGMIRRRQGSVALVLTRDNLATIRRLLNVNPDNT